jgi:hypothetical protein
VLSRQEEWFRDLERQRASCCLRGSFLVLSAFLLLPDEWQDFVMDQVMVMMMMMKTKMMAPLGGCAPPVSLSVAVCGCAPGVGWCQWHL